MFSIRPIFANIINTFYDVRCASIVSVNVWRHPGLAPTTAFCYRIHRSDGSSDSPLLSWAQCASKLLFFPLASNKRCVSLTIILGQYYQPFIKIVWNKYQIIQSNLKKIQQGILSHNILWISRVPRINLLNIVIRVETCVWLFLGMY